MYTIDLNSDVGEGMGNEEKLMPFIGSCNIACGAHAGNDVIIQEVIHLAVKHGVKIGAHPGYPDPENFGREEMLIAPKELRRSIREQLLKLKKFTESHNQTLHHVKPHGALYNKAAIDKGIADVIIEVILEIDDTLSLYAPYGSVIQERAAGRLRVVREGFADRAYETNYSLLSRKHPKAILHEPKAILDHVLPMICEKKLYSHKGEVLPFAIDTLCVHGDTPEAIDILRYLHEELPKNKVQLL